MNTTIKICKRFIDYDAGRYLYFRDQFKVYNEIIYPCSLFLHNNFKKQNNYTIHIIYSFGIY